jgi:hypothetical protein
VHANVQEISSNALARIALGLATLANLWAAAPACESGSRALPTAPGGAPASL